MEIHTDIKVLETRFENLDKSVDAVSHKIDGLHTMQEQWIRLQEQHEKTRGDLDRALLLINTMSILSADTETKLNKALYVVRGFAAAGVLLFGFAQWYMLQQLEHLKEMKHTISGLDHRMTVMEEMHKPGLETEKWPMLRGAE